MARKGNTDLGLKFLHQAFGLEALHFGLFANGVPHNLDGLKAAQEEYTKTLIGLVPEGARTVLDVGCGVGGTSKALKDAGFAVEGLSPDPYHKERFPETCGPGVPFHHSKFEPFDPGKTYDWKDFVARAERAGFKVAFHRDITEEVIPNLEVSMKFLGYGRRLLGFATDAARKRSRVLWKLIRMFYGRKLDKVRVLLEEKLPHRLDADFFRKTMSYAMYRFERP
ncbi:MAG: methyltransferase domain-containing protein [Planctomycetota bacterium]